MTQTIEQLSFYEKFCQSKFKNGIDRQEAISKDWEQLTTRVRELEESIESHAPEGRNYTNQQVVEMRQRFLDKLAASQLYAEQLREAIEQYLAENDPSEFGCACDPSVGHLCGPCFAHKQQTVLRKALALPRARCLRQQEGEGGDCWSCGRNPIQGQR